MPDTSRTRTDRVYIDESVIDVYRQLKRESHTEPENAPFDTYKDLFMFAASLGYQNGRRTHVNKGASEIRVSVFTEDDMAILKAIALAETEDVEVLARDGEILAIAEEYASAGIYEVKAYLMDQGGRPLWNLVNLLKENET